jgi:hypothetical protein
LEKKIRKLVLVCFRARESQVYPQEINPISTVIFKDDIGIYDLGNYTTTFESKIKHSKCTKIK